MTKSRYTAAIVALGVMVLRAGIVSGQTAAAGAGPTYPNKPIRLVTSERASGLDVSARQIAHGLTGILGQQVIVDNRPSGVLMGSIVSKAPPDGYTLLMSGSSHWLLPFLQDHVPYDPVKDFSPVILAVKQPNLLIVYPGLPAKSVQELIALAKSKPGHLNYASSAAGTASHLAGELFKAMAGVNIVCVNYKGPAAALTDLIGGQVQMAFPSVPAATPHVKSGKLRALAIGSAQPSALAPGLPTIAESGVPGYEISNMIGILAPAKTPTPVVNRLNLGLARYLSMTEVKEKFLTSGAETVASSPDQFAARMRLEMTRMGKVIRDAGIRVE